MTNVRHYDVLEGKEIGDTWQTLMAPEEYHRWLKKKPWDSKKFRSLGVGIVRAYVSSFSSSGDSNKKKFSPKAPLVLENGIQIESGGMGLTAGRKKWYGWVPADGIIEFNQSMNLICKISELDNFMVKSLIIYNKTTGAEIEFKLYNPDSQGTRLYLFRVWMDGKDRLYEKISIYEQQFLCSDFYEKKQFAGCELVDGKPTVKCVMQHFEQNKNKKQK